MDSGICKRCGAVITWRFTAARKWQPCDLDGQPHFPTCRRRVAEQRAVVHEWYERLGSRAARHE